MQLIGMLDSPYVRRVAISLKCLGLPFEHQSLSVFRNFEEFSQINPLVKAPTLICDDSEILLDSSLILDYLEALVPPEQSLMPATISERQQALQIIGLALAACDKTVQIVYEHELRPASKYHQPWLDRVTGQLTAAYDLLETAISGHSHWFSTDQMMQPDITVAVAWRFTQFMIPQVIDASRYPALVSFSAEAETTPPFIETPLE